MNYRRYNFALTEFRIIYAMVKIICVALLCCTSMLESLIVYDKSLFIMRLLLFGYDRLLISWIMRGPAFSNYDSVQLE